MYKKWLKYFFKGLIYCKSEDQSAAITTFFPLLQFKTSNHRFHFQTLHDIAHSNFSCIRGFLCHLLGRVQDTNQPQSLFAYPHHVPSQQVTPHLRRYTTPQTSITQQSSHHSSDVTPHLRCHATPDRSHYNIDITTHLRRHTTT